MSGLMTSGYRSEGGRRPSASLVLLPPSATAIALCSISPLLAVRDLKTYYF
jgi:hypothetical protein